MADMDEFDEDALFAELMGEVLALLNLPLVLHI
jgi:hypothetical protein